MHHNINSRVNLTINEQLLLSSSKYIKQKEYWITKLTGPPAKTGNLFHMETSVLQAEPIRMATAEIDFSPELSTRILHLGNQTDITIYIILLAGLKSLIYRYTGNEDITVLSPAYKLKSTSELINDSILIRERIGSRLTFKDLLIQLKSSVLEAYENQDYPFNKVLESVLGETGATGTKLQDEITTIQCSLQNIHGQRDIQPIRGMLAFSFNREGDEIKGEIHYDAGCCNTFYIEQLCRHFAGILEDALGNVNARICDISYLSKQETRRLIFQFNDNKEDFSRDKTVNRFIETLDEENPHRLALACERDQVTYRQLNLAANRIALQLQSAGVGKDQTVGIMLDRSPMIVATILAVWKAGGAYIPIDPASPAARIADILRDSNAAVLVVDRAHEDACQQQDANTTIITVDRHLLEQQHPVVPNPETDMDMNSLAYVIYTSGSTGKPKGAMVEHIGMMNHLQAKINDLQLSGGSVVVQNASIAFDISVWQFFAALCVGGETVIYPDEIILEPNRFLNRLLENAVTILEVVPSYLTVLLDAMDMPPPHGSPGSSGSSRLPLADTLVYLLVTGEELKPHLVKQWFALYPEIKMVNAYGPTEASDDITHFIMDKPLAAESIHISIGKSLQNLFIYIVDENMKLCPVGIKGEICVAGVGVGRGYVGAVEKTHQAFMCDPFDEKQERRLYKTGDLGRWYPDGNIEFLGRKDYQVKIRGFRIELGEIESKLLNVRGIKNAVVEDKEDKNGNKYLCAYIALASPQEINIPDLKEKLAVSLPEYMVPAHFVEMEKLPLTPNGKIDRKALPDPVLSSQPEMMYISEQMLNDLVEKEKKSRLLPIDSRLKDLDDPAPLFDSETIILNEYSEQTGKTCHPLNHSQKMMYYIEKTYPGTSCENEGYIVKYNRQLDKELLEKAINLAIYRNEHLRTRILEIEHRDYIGPAQYICHHSGYLLDYFDLSDRGGKGGRDYLEKWVLEKNDIPFYLHDHDLFYFAYLKFNSSESGYYFKFNHIISDGASVSLLFKEIDEIYNDLKAGKVPADRLNPSHIQFMQDEREYLTSSRAKNDREFWVKYLLPLPEEFIIGSKGGDPNIIAGNTRKLVLPDSLRSKMHEYARTRGISLYKLVLSALAIYISKITRLDEFIISTINHGRDKDVYRTMSGMFINFIPLKMEVNGSMDFKSFAEKVGKDVNYILKNHSKYPSGRISSDATKVTGEDTRYFWNITLIGHPDEEKGNFEMEHFSSGYEATPLVIHINCSNKDIEGILELEWIYQLEQFSTRDIMNLHRGLVTILADALDNPGKQIDAIECFTKEEKEKTGDETGGETPDSPPLLMEIKGNKIDARNIEKAVLGYNDVKDAVVVSRKEKSGDKYLCAFVVADNTLSEADIREYLAGKLPPFMIPAYFVRLEKMPLTSGGEVNRNLLKTIYLDMARESKVPMDETENQLAEIWQEVLAIEKHTISRESNFFSLGGHSLKAVMLAAKIHRGFNVKLALVLLFDNPTLRGMAGIIKELTEVKYVSIPNTEKKAYYALSSAQKRLFILQRFEPALTHYNIPLMVLLKGNPEMTRIESTFKELIRRHESLRTSFELINGEPKQKIHEQVEFQLEYYLFDNGETDKKIKEEKVKEITGNFIRPFTLSQAPLLRVGLVKQDENLHILMVDLHHIIADGVAHNILVRDFTGLYAGEELPLLRLRYKDYSEWQQQSAEESQRQEDYWIEQFAGEIPVLNLPIDYPRPVEQSFAGDAVAFELSRQETNALNRLARSCGATLFMTLLSVYYVFLSKLSGQEDIVTGTPTAGRTHADLDHIVGMFVNTLALRAYPAGPLKFADFLEQVKEKTLAAFENQGYQFEDLVEKVSVRRDISRNPLFDVMFTVQNVVDVPAADPDNPPRESQGLKLEFYPQEHIISKFDFSLAAVEAGEVLYFTCEFRSKLFKKQTILRFIDYFKQLVSSILEDPSRRLSQSDIIPETEKRQLLTDFNETGSPYSKDKTLDELLEIQAARNPDCTAVVYVDPASDQPAANRAITYRQLSEKAHGLAQQLQAGGVGPDTLVGLMVDRSIDMITGMLGILKAGGAYVPIDPEYPQDRIEYMLADSSARLLVTTRSLEEKLKEIKKIPGTIFIDCDDFPASSSSHLLNFSTSTLPRFPTSHPANLAYVLYTSGSTGRPKGVPVQQNNVARLVLNSNFIRWQAGDRLLLTGSMAFDITTFEIWGPLLNGLILYLAPQEIILAGKKLQELLEQHRINILHLIPQLFNQLADQHPGIFAGLEYFLVGGDLVRPHYVNRIRNMYSHLKILHMYGPTENTTFSTYLPVEQDYEPSIPIGKPIGNSTVYIIDRYDCLVPMGVPGELTVGGDGVARGYLNRPELTNEKFIINPFSEVNGTSRGAAGERIYKTGDLARWLPEGIIEFLGRQDSQVKIRGIRIEIEEIESQLTAHPDIKETVVISRENETNETYLCAYFLAGKEIPITQLRKYLAEKLPEYMIPAYFIQLEAFPLSSNGKVDQKALPQPGVSRPALETEFAAPRSRLETSIANIWKEVLNLDKVGIHDNFFDLGGNSLIIVKVNTQLNRELDREIPLVKMFRYPTIESLARSLKEETGEAAFNENIEESVTEMEETMQMFMGEDDE